MSIIDSEPLLWREVINMSVLRRVFIIFALTFIHQQALSQLPSVIDLAPGPGDEDVLIYGGDAMDTLTEHGGVIVGDLNGDGMNDLILGAPRADGPGNNRSDAGEAYVYYGDISFESVMDIAGVEGSAPDVTIYGADAGDED